jgi:hypothetical protein
VIFFYLRPGARKCLWAAVSCRVVPAGALESKG